MLRRADGIGATIMAHLDGLWSLRQASISAGSTGRDEKRGDERRQSSPPSRTVVAAKRNDLSMTGSLSYEHQA